MTTMPRPGHFDLSKTRNGIHTTCRASIFTTDRHRGSVRGLAWNALQPNLFASGATDAEVSAASRRSVKARSAETTKCCDEWTMRLTQLSILYILLDCISHAAICRYHHSFRPCLPLRFLLYCPFPCSSLPVPHPTTARLRTLFCRSLSGTPRISANHTAHQPTSRVI